jgi:FAD/FMN-containing dehydrogenase
MEQRTAAPSSVSAETPPIDVVSDTDLAARLTGRLVTPDDADWDTARQAWNLAVDRRPEFVVFAETPGDVAATLEFARAAGLTVTPQGTGHNAGARVDLSGTILLRTDRMREVTVDPDARTVRAGAGVLWQEVAGALAPHGLVGLAGSSGDVGVVGYLLGGGYSWFARKYGLGCSSVTAVEIVTGDGELRRVDAEHDPDLFWAVRGGAGNAGIVTSIEFTVYPCAQVYAGTLLFPIERAREVLTAYEAWTRDLDEAASTCVRLLRIPPLPDIPEQIRGKSFVGIDGAIDLPVDQAEALLAPMRALGPAVDMFAPMPAAALGHIHMDPPQPSPARADGIVLDDLTPDGIEALLTVAGPGVASPLLAVDLRHMGGAVGRPAPGGGAVDHLPGRFLLFAVGITPVPEAEAAVVAAIHGLTKVLEPWRSGRDYINFRDVPAAPDRFYPSEVLERLRKVQQRYDPQRVVRPNQQWAA